MSEVVKLDPSETILELAETVCKSAYLPDRHSFFQIKNFIIGKEGTIQAKLWQIIREIRSRRESAINLLKQIEKSELTSESIKIDIESAKLHLDFASKNKLTGSEPNISDPEIEVKLQALDIKKKEIHIKKLEAQIGEINYGIVKAEEKLKYVLEETKYLINAFQVLSEKEKVKPFDDEQAQAEYWNDKCNQEIAFRSILKLPIDVELAKTVLALPNSIPVRQEFIKLLNIHNNTQPQEIKAND